MNKNKIETEAKRLQKRMSHLNYSLDDCRLFAPFTARINELKKEKNAVILAHYYQRPEIQFGIANYQGDSLALAKAAQNTTANIIVFCGVHFMAETAKLLNPSKKVLLPSLKAGCSLSESITSEDVRKLKEKHPGIPVITYINTSADVKAESDIICTSANAKKIIDAQKSDTIIFLPDKLMGANLAKETDKKIIMWDGTCIVHDSFSAEEIKTYKKTYPELKVISHYECTPEVKEISDYMGGTTGMLKYAQESKSDKIMVITECGFSDYLKDNVKGKEFITPCSICPHMKEIQLENTLEVLEKENNEINIDSSIVEKAKKSVERMMEYS